eukprot:348204-Rhodomonas_salina.6
MRVGSYPATSSTDAQTGRPTISTTSPMRMEERSCWNSFSAHGIACEEEEHKRKEINVNARAAVQHWMRAALFAFAKRARRLSNGCSL